MITICNTFDKDVNILTLDLFAASIYPIDKALRKETAITGDPLVAIKLLADNVKLSSKEVSGTGGSVYNNAVSFTLYNIEQWMIDALSDLLDKDLVVRATGAGGLLMILGYDEQPMKLTYTENHPPEANKPPYLSVKITGKSMLPIPRLVS